MYIPQHFSIEEWVPQEVFSKRGSKAWWLLDAGLLRAYDQVRKRHGRVVINTWHSSGLQALVGGQIRTQSGLRTYHHFLDRFAFDHQKARMHYDDKYFSDHKYGRAGDGIMLDANVSDVWEDIESNPDIYPDICSMEKGVSWLHISTRNVDRLQIVYP